MRGGRDAIGHVRDAGENAVAAATLAVRRRPLMAIAAAMVVGGMFVFGLSVLRRLRQDG